MKNGILVFLVAGVIVSSFLTPAYADTAIDASDVIDVRDLDLVNGVGGVDWMLFSGGFGSNDDNEIDTFNLDPQLPEENFDDANDDLPGGGSSTFSGFYLTCGEHWRDFHDRNFGLANVDNTNFFLTINESDDDMNLDKLKIWKTSGTFDDLANAGILDPCSTDLGTDKQVDIKDTYTTFTGAGSPDGDGTVIADTTFGFVTIAEGMGASKADARIITGVDPNSLLDTDNILIYFEISSLSNGKCFMTIAAGFNPGGPGVPPGGIIIGGQLLPIDTTVLLLAGVQSVSMWMIPVVVSVIGIGVFVIKRRK
jgi:hypothetical protein